MDKDLSCGNFPQFAENLAKKAKTPLSETYILMGVMLDIAVLCMMQKRQRIHLCRDGFRERGDLGHLSFWGARKCDLFGHLCEKRESMPLFCVVPPQNLCFMVPTLVLQLP